MTQHVVRPNRHSHQSQHGPMRWSKKTVETKVWPRPKKAVEPEFIPVNISETGIQGR